MCCTRVRSTVAAILLVIAGICVRPPSHPRCHFRAPHFIQFNTQKIRSGRGRAGFGVKVTSAINTKCVPHYQTHLFAELEYQRRGEGGVSRVSSKAHVLRWTLTHLSHCRSRDEDKKNGRVARRRSKEEGRGQLDRATRYKNVGHVDSLTYEINVTILQYAHVCVCEDTYAQPGR